MRQINRVIEAQFPRTDPFTTSGWVTQRLGGFPKTGDVLQLGAYELRVESTEGARVARLKLTRQPVS